MITEVGRGPFQQCIDLYQHFLTFLDRNSDVWYGWTTWGRLYSQGDLYLSLSPNSTFHVLTGVSGGLCFAPLK
jgi:endoglucanase